MINIVHEDGKFLFVHLRDRILVSEGVAGNVFSAPDGTEYEWFDSREEAVLKAKKINPEWVDPEDKKN